MSTDTPAPTSASLAATSARAQPIDTIVYYCDGVGVFLRTPDHDLAACSSMLDETEMPDPPRNGLWLWLDAGSRPTPPGLDSMYSESITWVGAWRRLTQSELRDLAGPS